MAATPLPLALRPGQLTAALGGSYARQLGITLADGDAAEIHKWFVAALLFGARISEYIAERTYRELAHAGLLRPQRILDVGWDALVQLLDRGGYARYDFKTATKLQDAARALIAQYGGDLNALHEAAADPADLERRLQDLAKGIGTVTVNIFLRELRGIWPKANPQPSERAMRAARALHYLPARQKNADDILAALQRIWRADHRREKDFPEFEAALVRYGGHARGRRPHDNGKGER